MRTIAIISQKGGAGKTTLAVHLAVYAEQSGLTTAVIDLDPQATAAKWGDRREETPPEVISAQAVRLPQLLTTASEGGADLTIIDTAPNSDSTALAAAKVADLILIPCRPATFDLDAIGTTVDMAKLANVSAVVVLNAVPTRGTLADEARAVVAGYGVPVAPVHMHQRAAYANAVIDGRAVQEYEPNGKAAEEISRLHGWICSQVGLSIGKPVNRLTHKKRISADAG
jgi:chromosome partitioning protein